MVGQCSCHQYSRWASCKCTVLVIKPKGLIYVLRDLVSAVGLGASVRGLRVLGQGAPCTSSHADPVLSHKCVFSLEVERSACQASAHSGSCSTWGAQWPPSAPAPTNVPSHLTYTHTPSHTLTFSHAHLLQTCPLPWSSGPNKLSNVLRVMSVA